MALPPDTLKFIQRWLDKVSSYRGDSLEDRFDRFFSVYVLYNFLFSLVNEREGYGKRYDCEAAVCVARKFLGADALHCDTKLRQNMDIIRDLITDKTFYIRDNVWDTERVVKLNSNDPEQWSKGALEVLYKIRCNTFHGSKSFSPEQAEILLPCINALGRVCIMMIEKLSPEGLVNVSNYHCLEMTTADCKSE